MSRPLSVSVIIPAHNAAATLTQTLRALTNASPPPLEILVADDGSTDETAILAKACGVQVVSLEKNIGAAAAKNCGARVAAGDILFFTDADIVPPPNVIGILQDTFAARECEGVIGLLDQNIPAQNWASQFKNLWMNFTYARFHNAERIGLFYTSVAAMKRATFLQLGGFDENYRGASIAEDTEFGQRAWAAGNNIVLEPALRVVHLKVYSVASVLREDFKRARALTLMRLRKLGQPFFTSVPGYYQLSVVLIYLVSLFGFLGIMLLNGHVILGALILLLLFYAAHDPFLKFLLDKRGNGFAIRSALFLPLDVFVVGLGMLNAFFDFARGQRY